MLARELGFEDYAERVKIGRWNRCDNEPLEFNEDSPDILVQLICLTEIEGLIIYGIVLR